jgi:hypothetical protein
VTLAVAPATILDAPATQAAARSGVAAFGARSARTDPRRTVECGRVPHLRPRGAPESAARRIGEKTLLAIVLAWAARFVDAAGYPVLHHLFTSHRSGNSAALGAYLGRGEWREAMRGGGAVGAVLRPRERDPALGRVLRRAARSLDVRHPARRARADRRARLRPAPRDPATGQRMVGEAAKPGHRALSLDAGT